MLFRSVKQKEERLEIYIPNGPRLGDKVINVEGLTKAYDDKILINDLSFTLPPAGIVGIIGPNGAGKTTLFRMIMGQEQPDSGKMEVGETRVGDLICLGARGMSSLEGLLLGSVSQKVIHHATCPVLVVH